MTNDQEKNALQIKKYSNRRFYDTTRSTHITLREMHDLICNGYEIQITDSKSGQDITNVVLTQIILERDHSKLDIFPASVLHQVIRTQQEFLGSVVEQFFAQVLKAHRSSQEQWVRFLQNTIGLAGVTPTNPLEWTRSFMESFTGAATGNNTNQSHTGRGGQDREVTDLRQQVAELKDLVERLERQRPRS